MRARHLIDEKWRAGQPVIGLGHIEARIPRRFRSARLLAKRGAWPSSRARRAARLPPIGPLLLSPRCTKTCEESSSSSSSDDGYDVRVLRRLVFQPPTAHDLFGLVAEQFASTSRVVVVGVGAGHVWDDVSGTWSPIPIA